jgi:hypothetical protein
MTRNTQEPHERTPLERRLATRLKGAAIGECLSFEQLISLARRGRRAPEYYTLMPHVISCPACRKAVLQARALVQAQRPSLARWLQRLALPRPIVWAPALGVVALAFFLWRNGSAPQNQIATQPPTDSEPSVVVAQPERAGEPQAESRPVESDPRIAEARPKPPASPRAPLTPAPPTSQRELQVARQLPAFVREAVSLVNQAAALTTRSAPAPAKPAIEFLQPDLQHNGSLTNDTVRFQWLPVSGAQGYRFTLQRADGGVVATADLNAEQTEYTLSAPLQAGEYEIAISAVMSESPTRTLRRQFYVLDAAQQRRYEWAQQHADELPLLSAAVFYSIDRYADALSSVEAAARKYPNDKRVSQWRKLIEARLNLQAGESSQ